MLLLALWLAGCVCRPEAPALEADAAPPRPNILLIVWDTARADRMSLYGHDAPTTPRVDAWAAEHGVVYDRAVSPAVWTLPSHASLFTGLSGRAHGVDARHTALDPGFTTVAEALGAQGYDTYAFVSNPYMDAETRLLRGFDQRDRPWGPGLLRKVRRHVASKLVRRDASSPISPRWPGVKASSKYVFKEAGPVAAGALFDWLDRRGDDEDPWFAFLNYMEVHVPRIPTMASRKAVMRPEAIEAGFTVEQTMDAFHAWMGGFAELTPLELEAVAGVYDAAMRDLDAVTGDLLDALAARGLADDTIVILTSDHGEQLGEHGLMLHKYSVYNTLSRVPLVVAWPGRLTPERRSEPFPVADTFVEILALAGAEAPAGLARPVRLPAGDAVTEFDAVAPMALDRIVKLHPRFPRAKFERTFQALESGRYKVIEGSDGSVELYDVVADPHELDDLSDDDPGTTAAMRLALAAWREAVPAYEHAPGGEPRTMDPELRAGLEALGYLEGGGSP